MAEATQVEKGWVQYPLRLRPDLKRRLEARARVEDRSLRWVIQEAIEDYLAARSAAPESGEGGD